MNCLTAHVGDKPYTDPIRYFLGHSQFPLLAEQVALWRSLSGTELYVPRRMAWFFHLGDEVIQMSSHVPTYYVPIVSNNPKNICIGYISSCLWASVLFAYYCPAFNLLLANVCTWHLSIFCPHTQRDHNIPIHSCTNDNKNASVLYLCHLVATRLGDHSHIHTTLMLVFPESFMSKPLVERISLNLNGKGW